MDSIKNWIQTFYLSLGSTTTQVRAFSLLMNATGLAAIVLLALQYYVAAAVVAVLFLKYWALLNQNTVLENQALVLENQKMFLANQEIFLANQATFLSNQDRFLANQQFIKSQIATLITVKDKEAESRAQVIAQQMIAASASSTPSTPSVE